MGFRLFGAIKVSIKELFSHRVMKLLLVLTL